MEGRVWEEKRLRVIHASTHVDKQRVNVSHSHVPCQCVKVPCTPAQECRLSKMSDAEMTVQQPNTTEWPRDKTNR